MNEENDLKIVEKFSDSYILIHKSSEKKLVYKECQLPPSESPIFSQIYEELLIRNTLDHKNLLSLFSFYWEEKRANKTALIFEHWNKSFASEINVRFQTQIHWSEQELLNTLEVLLWSLDFLNSNGLNHGNITPHSIVFSYDGFVKLADQFIEGNTVKKTIEEMIKQKNTHLAPEVLTNIIKQNFPSIENDLWQLGMIFLESCLLKPCLDIISWRDKQINFDLLNIRISEIEKIRSKKLADLLRILLDKNSENRKNIFFILKTTWPTQNPNNEQKPSILNISLMEKILKFDKFKYTQDNKENFSNINENEKDELKNLYEVNNESKEEKSDSNFALKHNINFSNIPHKNYFLSLEGIIEETEEDQKEILNEKDKRNLNKSASHNCEKRLYELQQMFENSRARTNEILSKGKSLIVKNSNNIKEDFLSNVILRAEKKHLIYVVVYQNHDKYEGDISKGQERDGFGVYYKNNGQIMYQGEWKNNVFHGAGILNNLDIQFEQEPLDYKNLNGIKQKIWLKYEGEFHLGKKNGNGILLFSNKEYYQGNFRNDIIHGFGCFHNKNGGMIFGEWKDGKMIRFL